MRWTIVPHSIASGWRSTESHRPWERGHPARCLGSRPLPLWHGRDAPAPAGRMPALHPPSRDAPPWVTSATPRLRCALTGVYSCPPEDLKGRPGSRELACVTFPTRRLSCRNSARPTMHFDLALAVASSEFKYPLSSCLCQNGEPHASYGRSTELTNNISRRTFMVGAATAAAAMRVWGANDRIRLGIIGSGDRGQYLMSRANEVGGIQWMAISDIYDARRDKAEKVAGTRVDKYADYRQLLDRKDIDGVIVATFDHAHSFISVDACKAGKDIYVEKPMTSLPEQGPPLLRAVREAKSHLASRNAAATDGPLCRSQAEVFRYRADRQGQHGADHLEWQQRLFDPCPCRHGAETCGPRLGRLPGLAAQDPVESPSAISTALPIGISPPAGRRAACSYTWSTSSIGS